jgi:hypothetical protein
MIPLIDGDILRYEVGAYGEYKDEEGNPQTREFNFVKDKLDQKISEICEEVWATEPPVIYLTMDRALHARLNKRRKKEGILELEYIPNFREGVATLKGYKENRKDVVRPFHYTNLTQYIMDTYTTKVAIGMEADDLMSIDQVAAKEGTTIICSRDKDLRITPGLHFGWLCGKQPQYGPKTVTKFGSLSEEKLPKEVKGDGLMFFYSQVLTGDKTDNIPGLPGCGPVRTYKLLSECEDEAGLFAAVAEAYEDKYGEEWPTYMEEQCHLLWMLQELDEEGEPIPYVMYDQR